MANQRLSKEKQALVLNALCEGVPLNATRRMFKIGKNAILRVIRESGEALADYMDKEFRDLPCKRIEMDEQWQYVGVHGQRQHKDDKRKDVGDFWLWAVIDSDTKLVFSHKIGKRKMTTGAGFVADVRERVTGNVQIATDNLPLYPFMIRGSFGYEGYSYGTETKVFGELDARRMSASRVRRMEAIEGIAGTHREAVVGSPDLASLTTSHIERVFLSFRQELKRYQRQGLGYSKDLETHKLATALHIGIYNLVRKHASLGTTPAVAAGVEQKRWSLEDIVELTERYWAPKREAEKSAKAEAKREAEDAAFHRFLAMESKY